MHSSILSFKVQRPPKRSRPPPRRASPEAHVPRSRAFLRSQYSSITATGRYPATTLRARRESKRQGLRKARDSRLYVGGCAPSPFEKSPNTTPASCHSPERSSQCPPPQTTVTIQMRPRPWSARNPSGYRPVWHPFPGQTIPNQSQSDRYSCRPYLAQPLRDTRSCMQQPLPGW